MVFSLRFPWVFLGVFLGFSKVFLGSSKVFLRFFPFVFFGVCSAGEKGNKMEKKCFFFGGG